MAIEEQPREDLMREATAYTRRLLMQVVGIGEPLFFGLRPDGGWSIYVGEDPVFQFNAKNEMRRAFVAGEKYMAEAGKLLVVKRLSRDGKVELRREVDAIAEQAVLESCRAVRRCVLETAEASASGLVVQATVPADDRELVAVMVDHVKRLGECAKIASVANANG